MPAPLDFPCPHCKAQPGDPCRRYDGYRCIPHHHRTTLVKGAQAQPPKPQAPKPQPQRSLFDE